MRCDFELKIRCRECRSDSFVQVFSPASERPPSNSAVRAMADQQLYDYECKACGGHLPWVISIYGIKDDRRLA